MILQLLELAGGRRAKLLGKYIKDIDVSSDENVVLKMQSREVSRISMFKRLIFNEG